MRRFLNPERLWTDADGPDEDRIKPHVLWLPHDQPQVLAYFARLREVLAPYQDVITPVAEPDLHMTIQKIDSRDGDGRRIDAERLLHAAPALQKALSHVAPISIEIGPPRASASAALTDVWPEDELHQLYVGVRAGGVPPSRPDARDGAGSVPPVESPCHARSGMGEGRGLRPAVEDRPPSRRRRSRPLRSAHGPPILCATCMIHTCSNQIRMTPPARTRPGGPLHLTASQT